MRNKGEFLFTSESVSEGHPDKVADRISDTVVDAYLAADPYARVACETLVTTNRIILAGETRGPESITREHLAHLARSPPISRWAWMRPATRMRGRATRALCSAMPAPRPTP